MSDPEIDRIMQQKLQESIDQKKPNAKPLIVNQDNFDNVINGGKPVLVDFWAEWCAPCRSMHPVFEKLAAKYADKVTFARLNVDENGPIAERFSVYSIPTFILFNGGKQVEEVIGAVGESGLEQLLVH